MKPRYRIWKSALGYWYMCPVKDGIKDWIKALEGYIYLKRIGLNKEINE